MSGVLRTTLPFGHLRLRLVLLACGTQTWALLPREDAERPEVALVSGFVGDGPEDLNADRLQEVVCHLRAFELQAAEVAG